MLPGQSNRAIVATSHPPFTLYAPFSPFHTPLRSTRPLYSHRVNLFARYTEVILLRNAFNIHRYRSLSSLILFSLSWRIILRVTMNCLYRNTGGGGIKKPRREQIFPFRSYFLFKGLNFQRADVRSRKLYSTGK